MTTEPGRVQPRIRKRTWLLLSLGAVILVAVVWSARRGLGCRTPVAGTAADPRTERLRRCARGRARDREIRTGRAKLDLAKADQPALEPVVQGLANAHRPGRKGLEKQFQVPVIYEMNQMMNVLRKTWARFEAALVRAMVAQGRLAELKDASTRPPAVTAT